ncbi:MAG: YdjY domain-containing protein, partial [Lentisphaeria bacterium]
DSKVVPTASGMKMGLVEINGQSLSFPAQVTIIKDMPIEVMISTDRGRLHETLFTTQARPFHLQTMLIAMGAENGARIPTEQANQGDFLKVEVEWKNAKTGKINRQPIEHFVVDDKNKPILISEKRWVFVGSEIDDSAFLADWTGDMLVNYSIGSGVIDCAEEDISSAKLPLHSNFPAELIEGSEVKVIISLLGKGQKKKVLGK